MGEKDAKIKELIGIGYGQAQVAQAVGVSRSYVSQVAKKNKLSIRTFDKASVRLSVYIDSSLLKSLDKFAAQTLKPLGNSNGIRVRSMTVANAIREYLDKRKVA